MRSCLEGLVELLLVALLRGPHVVLDGEHLEGSHQMSSTLRGVPKEKRFCCLFKLIQD